MKKSILIMGLLMLFTFSVFSKGQVEAPQQPPEAPAVQESMDLTFAYGGPNMGSFAETNQWFCDEVARLTSGKVNITIHWGGTLVAQPETLSAVGKGVADMGAAMGGPTVTQNPHWSTLSMAGAGQDPWAVMMATYEMVNTNKDIIAEMDAHNVLATHGYFPGTPILVLKKPVNSLKDLKGLRIRVATPDEAAAWASLGAESVSLAIPELYDSIDKGVVDGTVLTVGWSDTLKLAEVAPYWYRFSNNLLGGDVTTVINKDVWNDFSMETREVIDQVIKEYNDHYTESVLTLEDKVLKQGLDASAFQYEKIAGEVDSAYTKAIEDAHKSWFTKWDEKKDKKTEAVWDEYQQLVRKYQEEVTTKGYPWEKL
jgi:TRAP-type C4-dicarboxylate transport system substrate-binding protein